MKTKDPDKKPFEITRADGRSIAQVLCEHVSSKEPGYVFSYEELSKYLSTGSTRFFDRPAVQSAVAGAGPILGKIHKRTLQNVRNVGYRLAMASEHMGLAIGRQDKAGRQLRRGFEILRDVRFDEIKDENIRKAHEGQLLIVSALCHQISAHEKRINRVEGLIDRMLTTVTAEKA